MARITYVNEETHPDLKPIIETIRAQRRGKLIPVYGLLLHAPDIASSWMQFLNAVRWSSSLSPKIREMVILRVAYLNHTQYVIDVHLKNFSQSDGLTHEEAAQVISAESTKTLLSEAEQKVLVYVDELTYNARVTDATFKHVRTFYNEQEIVELSVLVGAYNMHNRVFNALEIDPE